MLLESIFSHADSETAPSPLDEETISDVDRAAIQAGLDSLEANGEASMEEVLADYGLTLASFGNMPETPLPGELNRNR